LSPRPDTSTERPKSEKRGMKRSRLLPVPITCSTRMLSGLTLRISTLFLPGEEEERGCQRKLGEMPP
jgi:hypothetical protein